MVTTSFLVLGYLTHVVDEETSNTYNEVIKAREDVKMPKILPATG
jgi:hypothetical protein